MEQSGAEAEAEAETNEYRGSGRAETKKVSRNERSSALVESARYRVIVVVNKTTSQTDKMWRVKEEESLRVR